MVSPDKSAAVSIDAEDGGILLSGIAGVSASDLYDPSTGKVLLVPGAPIDRPPPLPDRIRVGLIDSGVLPDHPQLRNLIVAMKDFAGDDPIDRIGHGTVVAIKLAVPLESVAAAIPELTSKVFESPAIVSAKVTGPNGKIELENVIEAIDWMATQGVRLVNMSLAFLGRKERYSKLCNAITRYATEPNGGILFSAAAGNFGPNVLAFPAACEAPNVISVGAVIDGRLWEQSGRGKILTEGRVQLLPAYAYHYESAQRLARTGAYGEARKEYSASIAAELNAPALFQIALLDVNDGDLDSAFTALMRAEALAPNHAEIEAHLGAVRLLQKQPAEARAHLDRAIELDPKNVRARTNRAIALSRLAEPTQALNDLVEARALTEDTSRIDGLISDLLNGSGVL
jgi:subtilisin family serine protease